MRQPTLSKNTKAEERFKDEYWQKLSELSDYSWDLSNLFKTDPKRGERYRAEACGLYLDYSKQLLDDSVLNTLYDMAEHSQLLDKVKGLQRGDKVNITEGRAALHTALRLPKDNSLVIDGHNINEDIQASLDKVESIANKVRKKIWRGCSGKAISDVINIGVGGSDLGPAMALNALDEWVDTGVRVHFISNMDGTQLSKVLKQLRPETTLFIVSSKSFSTSDTFLNADTALAWMQSFCTDRNRVLKNHFIAVSASPDKMDAWGIPKSNQIEFWEWVGGRFSMWSAIGLAIAIKIGMDDFRQMLAGAHDMDVHFANASYDQNLPVLLGLIGVWNSTFLDINAHTVLPYDGRLRYFPNYLMQLEMESNGKSVNLLGEKINYDTAPVMWGDVGSNAQHAFYQLLHQGSQHVSCDFIAPIKRYTGQRLVDTSLIKQHQLGLSNCLAQSRVLAFGNAAIEKETQVGDSNLHKVYRGNQPSTTILIDELTPNRLGALTALYEHKVFVMSVLWQINPFDQWGVEVGKVMAGSLYDTIINKVEPKFDSSTDELLKKILDYE